MNSVEIELFFQVDMYVFVEKEMRKAISKIAYRYSRVNKTHMNDFKIVIFDAFSQK